MYTGEELVPLYECVSVSLSVGVVGVYIMGKRVKRRTQIWRSRRVFRDADVFDENKSSI